MGGGYRKSRTHKAKKAFGKQFRVRRRTKDLDQVHEELSKQKQLLANGLPPITATESDCEDLPGNGLYACTSCQRNFIDQRTLDIHVKTKQHVKRMKLLKDTPYTQREAEAAGGVGLSQFRLDRHQK